MQDLLKRKPMTRFRSEAYQDLIREAITHIVRHPAAIRYDVLTKTDHDLHRRRQSGAPPTPKTAKYHSDAPSEAVR